MAKSKKAKAGKLVSWRHFVPKGLPYFPLQQWDRLPQQTDAQWAATLETAKRNRRTCSVGLAVFQTVATAYGYHKTCSKPVCRRMGRCSGRRETGDEYARRIFPLCGTVDMAERVVEGVKEMCGILGEKRLPMFAADGSLHRGREMLEDET